MRRCSHSFYSKGFEVAGYLATESSLDMANKCSSRMNAAYCIVGLEADLASISVQAPSISSSSIFESIRVAGLGPPCSWKAVRCYCKIVAYKLYAIR